MTLRDRLFRGLIAGDLGRLKLLSIVVVVAMLVGMLCSIQLWFPTNRTFPRAPLFFVSSPEWIIKSLEYFLSACLSLCLTASLFLRRSKLLRLGAVATLVVLVLLDQMRLQPWVYQYGLLLTLLALIEPEEDAGLSSGVSLHSLQLVVASLYFWSGIQKFNAAFSSDILPKLLAPFPNVLQALDTQSLSVIGSAVALFEALIGIGLLFRRTRNAAVIMAIMMHSGILTLLILNNYNSVVWPWNAALILCVISLFWKSETNLTGIIRNQTKETLSIKVAKRIAIVVALLPALSFFGWWDAYLSGDLYSGKTKVGVMLINEDLYANLPHTAREEVFRLDKSGAEILPLHEWSMAELNVPVVPERRVFRSIARQVCEKSTDKKGIELIINNSFGTPGREFSIERMSCQDLEGN